MAKKKELYVIDVDGMLAISSWRKDIEDELLKDRDYQKHEFSSRGTIGLFVAMPDRVQYLVELTYWESLKMAFKIGRISSGKYFGNSGIAFGKAVME